ncbi:MerR family transcriptional regulator [Bifidobacterium oedipodis]|uniref:Multidrug transporter n=1 Tax=Bifidobacterium oedipodis TaxID=2675322 RepID=A0A7Y0EP15_9BIFI|nr:multidrug transporter [Bifidobacterium sp. DSM 109957]
MADDDELLTIGEVAKLDGVSAKALRYYDAHGILKPEVVDPQTGYRYYSPDQVLELDVVRICLATGMPLDSLEDHRLPDGTLDWRGVLHASRARVDGEIARLRKQQLSLNDYLEEIVRKAQTPEDGVVSSDLQPTWLAAKPWPYDQPFAIKRYLRTMTALRGAMREADATPLLRRGILIDHRHERAWAYHQFDPQGAHDGPYRFDESITVINPAGGPAQSMAIERDRLSQCFDEGIAMTMRDDPEQWPHATMTEIWGSRASRGRVSIRYTRHRCAV